VLPIVALIEHMEDETEIQMLRQGMVGNVGVLARHENCAPTGCPHRPRRLGRTRHGHRMAGSRASEPWVLLSLGRACDCLNASKKLVR
jgi:hypothetical protein